MLPEERKTAQAEARRQEIAQFDARIQAEYADTKTCLERAKEFICALRGILAAGAELTEDDLLGAVVCLREVELRVDKALLFQYL